MENLNQDKIHPCINKQMLIFFFPRHFYNLSKSISWSKSGTMLDKLLFHKKKNKEKFNQKLND
jgi:hypothetical protein